MIGVITPRLVPLWEDNLLPAIVIFLVVLIAGLFAACKQEYSPGEDEGDKTLRDKIHDKLFNLRHWVGIRILGTSPKPYSQLQIVGRESEQNIFKELLQKIFENQNEFWALCLYGFGGIGKSALMEQYAKIVSSDPNNFLIPRRGTVATNNEGTAMETLPTFLMRVTDTYISREGVGLIEEIAEKIENSVIFIDNYPSSDNNFNNDFKTLVETLTNHHAKVLIVTASRILPPLPVTLSTKPLEIIGLNHDEVKQLISRWADRPLYSDIAEDFDNYYYITKGNPWIIRVIFGAPDETWKAIQEGAALHKQVGDINDLLREIWKSVTEPETKRAIEILSTVDRFSEEWPESFAISLCKNWPDIHGHLRHRGFVEHYSSGICKIHDLLADYVYGQFNDPLSLHLEVADKYRMLITKDDMNGLLALYHYIEAENIDGINSVYKSTFEHIRDRFATSDVANLIMKLEPYSHEGEIEAFIAKEFAYTLLRQGRIKEGLEGYEKAIELCENLETNLELEGEILWGMGDCYRMLGNFVKGMEFFSRAQDSFQNAASWQTKKYVQSMIEIGHGHYLMGEPTKSVELYKMAEAICKRNNFERELGYVWYRLSKSLRILGQYREAVDISNNAIEIFENLDMEADKAKALWNLGTTQRMQENYSEAEKKICLAKDLFKIAGHRNEVFTVHDLAEIARARSQYENALELYKEALAKIEDIGDENRIAHTKLGILETQRLKYSDGKNYDSYDKVRGIYERIQSKWGIVNCCIGQALSGLCLEKQDSINQDKILSAKKIAMDENMKNEIDIIDHIIKISNKDELHPLNFT